MHTLQALKTTMTGPVDLQLPSFRLTEKDLPEIKDWKVGKRYHLEMEVEQVEVSKDEQRVTEYIRVVDASSGDVLHRVGIKAVRRVFQRHHMRGSAAA